MRTLPSFVLFLAAATVVAPAGAQRATSSRIRAAVSPAGATAPTALRTVAIYNFAASRSTGLPAQVTVADSAGSLVASYRLPDSRIVSPMTVDVRDSDIVLYGATPSGVLTLTLYGQNDSDASTVIGRWTLGHQQGALRGRTER
jgi:hypothetical protein